MQVVHKIFYQKGHSTKAFENPNWHFQLKVI